MKNNASKIPVRAHNSDVNAPLNLSASRRSRAKDPAEPNEYGTSVRPMTAEQKPGNQVLRHKGSFSREAFRPISIPVMVPI